MTKPLVAFYDVHPIDKAAFTAALDGAFSVVMDSASLTTANLAPAKTAAILSVHVSSPITADVMAALPNLRHVACRSTGYDHVDLEYARTHGITISNVPAYGAETVAEYAFLLMLAVSRRLMAAVHPLPTPDEDAAARTGHQLAGATLGIIGAGRIGRHAAGIGRGFGMHVLAYDPYPDAAAAESFGYNYAPLAEVLKSSDFLSLHAPATPANRHLIGASEFALMKPGVCLVNTARGSLINTAALAQAISSGIVSAAGLDVVDDENLLPKHPNILITAHNAYNTYEALERIRQTTISNIMAWHNQKEENLV